MVERRTPERIPRKSWLRPYMAEKLFTETLKKRNKGLRRGYPTIHSLETSQISFARPKTFNEETPQK